MKADDFVDCCDVYPTISVTDLESTVQFYRDQLGFEVEFLWGEPPVHAGVKFGKATLHFNQGDGAVAHDENSWLYFLVDDVDAYFDFLKSKGTNILDVPTQREWGMREINVRDLNGIALRFAQVSHGFGDPIHVQRVDVGARIERRLADLMRDLAEHKGMTVGQMLEETLLHSFEPLPQAEGEGVASPHTARTLKYIEQLKQRHGIDYKTHDMYRFTED